MRGEWWGVSDKGLSDEGWVMRGEWWVVSDEGWVMRGEWYSCFSISWSPCLSICPYCSSSFPIFKLISSFLSFPVCLLSLTLLLLPFFFLCIPLSYLFSFYTSTSYQPFFPLSTQSSQPFSNSPLCLSVVPTLPFYIPLMFLSFTPPVSSSHSILLCIFNLKISHHLSHNLSAHASHTVYIFCSGWVEE